MSSYHINDLDNYPKTYSFLPNHERDENGENLMTQSLVIQAPYRRIRHPELTPVILNRDRDDRNHGKTIDIMSQSLIVPPYRRMRHAELMPVLPKESSSTYKTYSDVKNNRQLPSSSYNLKAPKRAFSMTRLDQLAKPRQRYLEEALKLRASKTKENLCFSSVRPTSSMSLASKQPSTQQQYKQSSSANNNHSSTFNQSNNSGTILLRQRTSARKQRPISYAGYTSSSNNSSNQDQLNTTFSRSSVKSKSTFTGNTMNGSRTINSLSNPTPLTSRNLMVSSIDGSMLSSLSKPTPPRKPAHIKAAAASRKLAKQQQQNIVENNSSQLDRMKESDSTSRLNQNHLSTDHKKNGGKERMKKSITNPEKIAELLDEKMNLDDSDNNVVKNLMSTTVEIRSDDVKTDVKLTVDEDKLNVVVEKQPHQNDLLLNDLDSNSTFIVDEDKSSSNQVLIDLMNDEEVKESEIDLLQRTEEEEQETRRLENEEAIRRAQEEERKRLVREEKERELERKVKEKAEKARLELEERLKKDEQERIERKRRLDAIMSRTRKNRDSKASPEQSTGQQQQEQQVAGVNKQKAVVDLSNSQENPDVVNDAIKSNLIKLTKNENLNSINNGKNNDQLANYIENETIIENKNISLINGFKELKMSTNSTFVFSQTTSNEHSTFAPGAN